MCSRCDGWGPCMWCGLLAWHSRSRQRWDYQRTIWEYLGDGDPAGFGGYHGA